MFEEIACLILSVTCNVRSLIDRVIVEWFTPRLDRNGICQVNELDEIVPCSVAVRSIATQPNVLTG
jgi:hypothetical protein